ncbi:MBL fold metallo-hydrolase [Limimaricola cinnabarinus]|uniref:MBL fold metallo-hydrolase n=1 Tax=Limimaricola cinnabarinus TaxID=1125964 RepID=UPI0039E3FD64
MRDHLVLDALQGAGFCTAAALLDEPAKVRGALGAYGLFSIAAALLTDRPAETRRPVSRQIPLTREAVVTAARGGRAREIAPGVAYRRLGIVNVFFLGAPDAGDRGWILVDAGLDSTAPLIKGAAAERFGRDARPAAIVLTHGHFDHVGALKHLAERWDALVYAHPLEHPYLDGSSAYPPGDPTVGGGAMAALAGIYPTGPVDVRPRLRALPKDGTVPGAPGWRWLHTPGHAPGHVSLWQEAHRTLVAGDAVITTRQESAYAVAVQAPEIHGPPAYFTIDWDEARASARALADFEPDILVSGHGAPLAGPRMRGALNRLARDFDRLAVPQGARYARHPARPEQEAYR